MTDRMFIEVAAWVCLGVLTLIVFAMLEDIDTDFRIYRKYKTKEELKSMLSKAFVVILIVAFNVKVLLVLLSLPSPF